MWHSSSPFVANKSISTSETNWTSINLLLSFAMLLLTSFSNSDSVSFVRLPRVSPLAISTAMSVRLKQDIPSGPLFASVSLISKLTTSCSICILFAQSAEISPSPGSFTSNYFSLPSLWSATCSKLTYHSPWFSAKCPRYTVAAETLADGLNACCTPILREETIWMSMLYKFAVAYSVIWSHRAPYELYSQRATSSFAKCSKRGKPSLSNGLLFKYSTILY